MDKHRLVLFFCIFFVGSLMGQSLSIKADRADAYYSIGTEMNFELMSSMTGVATYEVVYDKHAPVVKRGTLDLVANEVYHLPFSLEEPGLVVCKLIQNGEIAQAAAAFSPFKIESFEEEPADFDAFWAAARAEGQAVPLDAKMTLYEEREYSTVYRINFAHIYDRRVYGYLSIPKMEGPYPAVISYPAFGGVQNVVTPTSFIADQAGALALTIGIHNAEPDERDPNAYNPNAIDDPYGNYYYQAVLGCVRAVDYMFSRDDFNGELAVSGVSQGGGLALMVAGLDERVDLLVFSNSTHCDHTGLKYGKASGFPYYINQGRIIYDSPEKVEEIAQASKYYDAVYFARRYKGATYGVISYKDDVSPPSTVFAAFNALRGTKTLLHAKQLKHAHPVEYWVGRFDSFRRFLPSSLRIPWPYPRTTKGYLADAGDQIQVSVGTVVQLEGRILKDDGPIDLPVEWKLISGPGEVVFNDINSLRATAEFSTPGTYILQLMAHDYALLDPSDKYFTTMDYVTVEVKEALSVTCPNDVILLTEEAEIEVDWNLPSILAFCGDEDVQIEQIEGRTRGTAFPLGSETIAYQITDECGNAAQCNFQVHVVSTANGNYLDLNCPNDILIHLPSGKEVVSVQWNTPTVDTNCKLNLQLQQTEGAATGSLFDKGIHTIAYSGSNACARTGDCSFRLIILDDKEERTRTRKDRATGSEINFQTGVEQTPYQLYPNPVQKQLQLSWSNEKTMPVELTIINTVGQVVKQLSHSPDNGYNQLQLDVDKLASGVYFLQLRQGNELLVSERFVKE